MEDDMKTTWMPRVGVIMTVLMLSATMAQAVGTQLLVTNVQAQQRQFTATWEVTYDLETVGDIAVAVSLSLSTDSGGTYPNLCATVTGDIGAGVLPGAGRHIVWDAAADFPGLSSSTCRLRVTADDGQGEAPAVFVTIPSGTFIMGSPTTEVGHDDYGDEAQHQVTLTHGIDVQTTEVTNQQYRDMAQWAYDNGYVTVTVFGMYDNLDGSTEILNALCVGCDEITFSAGVFSCINPAHPVKYVNWYGAAAYCDWLSLQQSLPRAYDHSTWQCNAGNPYTATGYRLPTEAEWEYACRAGAQTPFNTGSCLDASTEANYNGSDPYTECPTGPYVDWTVPVGSYPANAFGLYDMHGNLYEWCNDWYDTYGGTVTDPVGAAAGSYRVFRGGGWGDAAGGCRSAIRNRYDPSGASPDLGFRVVRSSAP
jgi:formylglycine-generating enzyme required for sulfatase activity